MGMTEYLIILAIVAIAAVLVVALFGKQIKGTFTSSTGAIGGTSEANPDFQSSSLVKSDTMGSFNGSSGGSTTSSGGGSGGSGNGSGGSGSGSGNSGNDPAGSIGGATTSGGNSTSPNSGDGGSSRGAATSGGGAMVSDANASGTGGSTTVSGKNSGSSKGGAGGNSSGGPASAATVGAQSQSGASPAKSDDIVFPIRENSPKPGLVEYIQSNFLLVVLILIAVGLGLYCASTYLTLKKKQ